MERQSKHVTTIADTVTAQQGSKGNDTLPSTPSEDTPSAVKNAASAAVIDALNEAQTERSENGDHKPCKRRGEIANTHYVLITP